MIEPRAVIPSPEGKIECFMFDSWRVRVIDRDGSPWWVLADVCEALGLSNPSMVVDRLQDDERAKFNLGRQGEATIINESGLYAVILRSDKPDAKRFRHWITSEVLPSIRKTGGYGNVIPKGRELVALALVEAQKIIEEMTPKAELADRFLVAEGSVCLSDAAKALGQSPRSFFPSLSSLGLIFRRGGEWIAAQKYLDLDWFRMREGSYQDSEGVSHLTVQTRVTPRGLDALRRYFPQVETV